MPATVGDNVWAEVWEAPEKAHDVAAKCVCVRNHNPEPQELNRHHILPLAWGGNRESDNEVWLCPTSHTNVHELLRAYEKYEGTPPWEIRKHFSWYIRSLAVEGWKRRDSNG
jgi:hypothetical protein